MVPLTSVKLDYLLLLEEFRKVFALWQGNHFAAEIGNIRIEIWRDRRTLVVVFPGDLSAGFPVSNRNHISDAAGVAGDVHNFAVHKNMAMADHLPRLEDRASIAKPPNLSGKPEFEQAQEVKARVAVHPSRFFERVAELLFKEVVISADYLLGE